LGETGTTGAPNKKGFDFWYGFTDQAEAHNHYPLSLWRNDQKEIIAGNQHGQRTEYAHDLFTKEALAFIEGNKDKPFFLYLAYTLPHADLEAPEDSLQQFRGKFSEKPVAETKSGRPNEMPNATFAAMVARLDRDVGRVASLLKQLGLAENTLVIFTTDNGAHDVDGKDPAFFNASGPLRGIKRDLYEGGIRVPFIARWPGKITAGAISHHVAAFWDFLPTAAELAGAPIPKGIDGISFLPSLLSRPQPRHEFLYFELEVKGVGSQAVRMGDWKAIRHGRAGALELYDLSKDIGEKKNVAAQHPDVVRKIADYLKTARIDSPQFPLWPERGDNRTKER
ncbi:MAG: sulfatase-like hydrolase/transferase, partial [Blastocatellia bacterium]